MLSAQHEHATGMSPDNPGAGIDFRIYQQPLLEPHGPGVGGAALGAADWKVSRWRRDGQVGALDAISRPVGDGAVEFAG